MPKPKKSNNRQVIVKEVINAPSTYKKRRRNRRRNNNASNSAKFSRVSATETLAVLKVEKKDDVSTAGMKQFVCNSSSPMLTKLGMLYDSARIISVRVNYVGYLGSQAKGNACIGIDYRGTKAPTAASGVTSLQPHVMVNPGATSRWIKVDSKIVKPDVVRQTNENIFAILYYVAHDKLDADVEIGAIQISYVIELSGIDP